MLTSFLFAGYSFGVGAIGYNMVRAKLNIDFEEDLKALREYDVSHETINIEKDLPNNCMILVKHHPTD
jgi:hypothetical protein